MRTTKRLFSAALIAALAATTILYASTTDFVTFTTGSVHYQGPGGTTVTGLGYTIPDPYGSLWTVADEWGFQKAAPAFDEMVVDDGTGNTVWRFSNAVTSGSFSVQPNSPSSPAVAGESGAFLWNDRGPNHTTPVISTRAPATTPYFHGSFLFKSATGLAQAGLRLNVSPTARQSDRRNSFVHLVDTGTGLNVQFVDTGIGGSFPAADTIIATGLSYTDWHRIDIYVEFVDGLNGNGSGNDLVTVLVNNVVVHVGTTWETYYRVATPTRPVGAVDALMFRSSTAAAGTLGNGFFFDDVVVDNGEAPPPTNMQFTLRPGDVNGFSNNVIGVGGADQFAPGFAGGSFAANAMVASAKSEIYFDPMVLFGRVVGVGEVVSMSYWTKTGATHAVDPRDWFLAIYTKPFAFDVSTPGWYGSRFGAEPYFSISLTDPADTWNEWMTDAGNNQLRFFESTAGAAGANFGSYTDPDWATFLGGNSLGTTVPRRNQGVLYFSLQTGSAWANGFTGQLDGFAIELTNGSIATVNFEPDVTGTITVRKTVDSGGASPTSFCFTLSPDPGNGQVCADGSGNAVFSDVPAGNYDATETAGLATYHEVSNTCSGLSIAALGDSRTCDVHNAINTGTITVRKTVVSGSASPTSFCFTLSPDPGNGQVCANGAGNAVFNNVPVGTYSAIESASLATYHLVSNTCIGLSIAALGDSRTCDVHNDQNPIPHDVDAYLTIGKEIKLGASGTKTIDVKAACKNESAPEMVRCTVQVSGLPAFCSVKNGAGPAVSGPGSVFLVDNTSSYAMNQTKNFDFKLTTSCSPALVMGQEYILTVKSCADGGVIGPDPCVDSDLIPDKSPNVVTKRVKLKR